jgi:Asp/Glu/hydantoin racemase
LKPLGAECVRGSAGIARERAKFEAMLGAPVIDPMLAPAGETTALARRGSLA